MTHGKLDRLFGDVLLRAPATDVSWAPDTDRQSACAGYRNRRNPLLINDLKNVVHADGVIDWSGPLMPSRQAALGARLHQFVTIAVTDQALCLMRRPDLRPPGQVGVLSS